MSIADYYILIYLKITPTKKLVADPSLHEIYSHEKQKIGKNLDLK